MKVELSLRSNNLHGPDYVVPDGLICQLATTFSDSECVIVNSYKTSTLYTIYLLMKTGF